MKKKLLLINPESVNAKGTFNEPLSLGIIAGLTPPDYEIELIDENYELFSPIEADIVAITATTGSINKAIKIAQHYNAYGVPVVIGGFHASLMPHELIDYFDSIAIGEAEFLWPLIIQDFEAGNLKKHYKQDINFTRYFAIPRREIFEKYPYPASTIETSRGCPFRCSFCSVNNFYSNTFIERSIEDIIKEIQTLKKNVVFFSDDNFIGQINTNRNRIVNLLYAIGEIKKKISFYCYSSMNLFYDDDILSLLKKAGCRMLLIGFESENEDDLIEINKRHNQKIIRQNITIGEVLKKVHKYGISVMGGFIIGFDNDDREKIYKRINEIRKSNIDWFAINILTPLPGTALFDKISKENRFIFNNYPTDWNNFNFIKSVFLPKNISSQELCEIFNKEIIKEYTCKKTIKRFFRTCWSTKSLKTAYYTYLWYSNHWQDIKNYKNLNRLIRFFKKLKLI